ncbi:MAG TPA: GNAT family N-acetyltransferase, partial [Bacillota bacterium]|nr:GNAT family N-acetyltransferase [Bacillota bacterium]
PGKGKCGHVEWLITAPEARGSGVGQSLLDAAIKLLQKKKVAEIFAVIDGHNIASANLFASRDFSLLSPGEQLRRYRFNLLLLWLHTFHYMDVGHFLWARPASPGQGSAAGQWFGNLVASIIIALLARWRLGGFASLPAEVMAATALSFVIIFGAREAAMQLTARLRGLKARYRAWESGLFFNLILALLFGWFFPVTGSIYPGEEKWRCREHKRSLGPAALAGALAVLLFAWAVPFYYLVLGGEPHPLLDTFATLAFMIAFFDIALPFFPFSGYNGRRLWDWNIMSWVIPAVLVALLFAV